MTVLAPAKVNLFLGVGDVREDGFHEVTTVLQALTLADDVTLSPADAPELVCDLDLGIDPSANLAMRAVCGLAESLGREPGLRVELRKSVPAGAGFGGGSSDAAAALLGAAHVWGLALDDPRILEVARTLGSDVPFFLQGGAALFTGRGERLERALPSARVDVVLLKPPVPISTAEAYATFDAAPATPGEPLGVIEALELGSVRRLAEALENNLQPAAFALVPELADAVQWATEQPGVLNAMVSGSGSGIFALCVGDGSAERLADEAADAGWWAAVTTTSAHGVRLVEGGW